MRLLLAFIALAFPAGVQAQALSCRLPDAMAPVRADLPSERQPVRRVPTGGYTLALTWAPRYCREHRRDPSARFQCASGNRFGFTLHGLWPDGIGKEWPQYCQATALVPRAVIRRQLCATPSPQLIQHEWAKHGTCMAGETPTSYFARSSRFYARLRYPDMDALSRRPLTTRRFAAAFARANPGLTEDMMRITADKRGWLDEVWLCLDKRFGAVRCPNHQGGLAPGAVLKIWRGGR